jgi:MYXO-CTERM domain-containing protein
MKLTNLPSAQHCKRLSLFLAAPATLLLSQGQAKAFLTYNIFESGGNVVVQTSGSLDLTGATEDYGNVICNFDGRIYSLNAFICTGPAILIDEYPITGPWSFNGTVNAFPASSVSGISTMLRGDAEKFDIDRAYTSATPIVSSATFNSTTLATLGFTTTGLIGTWTLNGTSETIQVIIGPPSPVPGPLPLFGVAAAFGWSRRLRKRITAPLITPPQA